MSKSSKETVYRTPDGERWRLTSSPKYGNITVAVRIKDGRANYNSDFLPELVEESKWLATQKKKSRLFLKCE